MSDKFSKVRVSENSARQGNNLEFSYKNKLLKENNSFSMTMNYFAMSIVDTNVSKLKIFQELARKIRTLVAK